MIINDKHDTKWLALGFNLIPMTLKQKLSGYAGIQPDPHDFKTQTKWLALEFNLILMTLKQKLSG
jgi:hypothetical protein